MSRGEPTRRALLLAGLALLAAGPAQGQDAAYTLTIAGNRFDKAELLVPANTRIVLVVKNTDKTPEEFESNDLRVEKVIPPGKEIRLTIGPLEPWRYYFFGDYHEATANGFLVAK
ncbi:MAG: cupredoxin domain-containing protein [Alphaproteobacteria bacterium]|nr:cupredoxin domain-containing protein [Alphaproteobacteria bacterium]